MYRIVVSLLMIVLFTSGCDLLDECSGDSQPIQVSGSGPRIQNPVELSAGGSYRYDLTNTVYFAEREGGRASCPEINQRPPLVDSVVVANPSVATARIVDASILEIRAEQSGASTVTVHMSTTSVQNRNMTIPIQSVTTFRCCQMSCLGWVINDNISNSVCRFHFNTSQKYLGLFDEERNEKKIPIASLEQI